MVTMFLLYGLENRKGGLRLKKSTYMERRGEKLRELGQYVLLALVAILFLEAMGFPSVFSEISPF